MEEQTNKVALLEKMNCGYAAFQTLLAVLGEAQMTTAEVNGSWSIKDILTHLTAWQRAMVDRLHAAARNEKPALTTDLTDEEIDRLNEQFYQEGKARPLAEALTDFRTTYLQIVEVVQALPWEDLADTHRFAWLNGIPLWRYVAGDTYEHYQEHIESIQEFLKTGQQRN